MFIMKRNNYHLRGPGDDEDEEGRLRPVDDAETTDEALSKAVEAGAGALVE
jgi:hypothetical protein